MAQNISLHEYANSKGISVSEVVRSASEKGVIIPNDPEYVLNNSILKHIDPVFHHQMRYGQIKPGTSSALSGLKIIGKMDIDNASSNSKVKSDTRSLNEETLSELRDFSIKHINERFCGRIQRVMPHGAYVSFEGILGFLYVKDTAWGYVDDIHNFLLEGEKIDVVVLGYDEKKKKLVVGRKQLMEDPLLQIAGSLSVGDEIVGVVKKISKRNRVYIEVDGGAIVESDIPNGYTYPEGQSISGVVSAIDLEQHLLEVEITSQLIEKPNANQNASRKSVSLEKNIAIVQFFDDRVNMFGIVLTNTLGINDEDASGRLLSLRMSAKDWLPTSSPNDGEWVIINVGQGPRGLIAKNGDRLTYDKKGLLLALPYRGKYARIVGTDRNGSRHDHNVICHVVSRILKNAAGAELVTETFAEYLASFYPNKQDRVIAEFLQDVELTKSLVSLLPEMKLFHTESEECTYALERLITTVEDSVFSKKDIDILGALPEDFDFISCVEKTKQVLEASAKDRTTAVVNWLKVHPTIVEELIKDVVSLSMDLLYALVLATQNYALFTAVNKNWSEIYDWLHAKSESVAFSFLEFYLLDKEQPFIVQSNIKQCLDYESKKRFVLALLNDPSHYNSVLMHLADEFVPNDFDIICRYVTNNIDISHISGEISSYLNSLVKDCEVQVRKFLELCSEYNLLITDIVGTQDEMSDEMAVEMFSQTANLEYLNVVADFEAVPKWLNEQAVELVCLFLQSCQKACVEEEDREAIADTLTNISDEKFRDSISALSDDDKYKILQLCPNAYANIIIDKYFASTQLFDLHIGEQWNRLKAKIPYVSFDLESDGESIQEFAFRTGENTKVYQGEEQIGSLLRALKRADIIVGHRIKEWDLGKVLQNRGL